MHPCLHTDHSDKVVYYMTDALFDTAQQSSVTAFKPGVRVSRIRPVNPVASNLC